MKSIRNLSNQSASLPLMADDILEFHAGRLLLLFKICGVNNRIEGLTKMAKLDFFVRYPEFFAVACKHLGKDHEGLPSPVESEMVRHHYGPWDRRYYHVLAYLEGRGLIEACQDGATIVLGLSTKGDEIAGQLSKQPAYEQLTSHMRSVKRVLGARKGASLKKMIYELFDEEVARLSMGEVIR